MLIQSPLRFSNEMLTRPDLGGMDVLTVLEHFSIITYTVSPDALKKCIHPRFEPVCIRSDEGELRALISVVPFRDTDFRFVGMPRFRFAFGQTNYRAYVQDRETGEHCVWFFGTTLDSPSVAIPRTLWKLPWHRGKIAFSCTLEGEHYSHYEMKTQSAWAAATVELEDSGEEVGHLPSFPDLETGRVILTHPLTGFYFRRDGSLGSYRVWHGMLTPHSGRCLKARFELLDRLGLVSYTAQNQPHSVLIQHQTEFAVCLPPHRV